MSNDNIITKYINITNINQYTKELQNMPAIKQYNRCIINLFSHVSNYSIIIGSKANKHDITNIYNSIENIKTSLIDNYNEIVILYGDCGLFDTHQYLMDYCDYIKNDIKKLKYKN